MTYSLVAKDEILETPAGKFKCYVYQFRKRPEDDIASIAHYNYYYSVEVGLVGYIVTWEGDPSDVFEEFFLWKYSIKQ